MKIIVMDSANVRIEFFDVAAYNYDEPCDVVILSVRVNRYGKLTIIGDEKNDRGNEHEIEADDIFAGQMSFITSEIGD